MESLPESTVSFHCPKRLASWSRFLRSQEPAYPGISQTAGKLLPTLFFALPKINEAQERIQGQLPRHPGAIDELARLMVRRAVVARQALLGSEIDQHRQQLQERLLRKLHQRPSNERDIYRALSIPAGLCGQLLAELEEKSLAQKDGPLWEVCQEETRAPSAAQSFMSPESPKRRNHA
ncbi:MAG: hypothetical protein Q7Q71_15445 [Verrucomicrobiota bacterium JB023]|nr:hypothetical protein [Verrucomicrobiota bacterium JB023]